MRRSWVRTAQVAAIAAGLFAIGAVVITPDGAEPERADQGASAEGAVSDTALERAQKRAASVPNNWVPWAELGLAYIEKARVTVDPSWYPKADEALRKSLEIRPNDNGIGLAGKASLAAALHNFGEALTLADQALAIDSYSGIAHSVRIDSLIELGRYDEAWPAVQVALDKRLDAGTYARASYSFELRGDTEKAEFYMGQALEVSAGAGSAFALEHLAMLAFNRGDLDAATKHVDRGLFLAPDYPPLLAVKARLATARGNTDLAKREWANVVQKLPIPAHAAEYGDLLAAVGDQSGAQQQFEVARATTKLFAAAGVEIDIDQATFEAEHGAVDLGLKAAMSGYAKRPSIFAADAVAWTLHLAGRDAEALKYANEALRLNTKNSLLLFHRGVIKAGVGDQVGAKADLEAALALNPNFSVRWAPVAKTMLAA